MKSITLAAAVAVSSPFALAATAAAQESQDAYEGWYNGGKVGWAQTSGDGIDSAGSWTAGYELGYKWQTDGGFVFGLDGYYDYNAAADHDLDATGGSISAGSHAYGMDTLYGIATDGAGMYYAKVGYGGLSGIDAAEGSGTGFHGGLGAEFKFNENWSVTGEWLYSAGDIGPADASIEHNNFTIGMNYYF